MSATLRTVSESRLFDVPEGSHVGWVVGDPDGYRRIAQALLAKGAQTNEKTIVFGPEDNEAFLALSRDALLATDPRLSILGGGPLQPDRIYKAFRDHIGQAREEGFSGLRVVADMDWLLPSRPTAGEVIKFELMLDRVVHELRTTVVCAYREASYVRDAIMGTLAVHPILSTLYEPPFRLVASDERTWRLSGEVDYGVADAFAAAVTTAIGVGGCVLDVSDLTFIDVSGMRTLARACGRAKEPVHFSGVTPALRRFWTYGRFDEIGSLREAPSDGVTLDPSTN